MSTDVVLANDTEVVSKIGRNLYLNAEKADVHFIFQSGDERVPAQKNILSSGSDVFDTMFYGSMKDDGDIEIVDATAEAFKEFLRFFYFNKVDVSMEHVAGVMYLSRKYNVAEGQRLCVNLLAANITDQTVISTLSLAISHEESQLQKSCKSFIAYRTDEIFKSEDFLVSDRRVLEHIVKMDYLACTEQALFEACMSWVRATSHEDNLTRDIVQTHLGRLFYEIRFGAMTLEEFGKLLPVYSELFSPNEYSELLRVFSGQERKPKIFQTKRRLPTWMYNVLITECNRGFTDSGRLRFGACSLESETVARFSSNTRLFLKYFNVAPLFDRNSFPVKNTENVNVAVIANSTEITQFICTLKHSNRYYVALPSPIYITPENIYEIRLNFHYQRFQMAKLFCCRDKVKMQNNIVIVFQPCSLTSPIATLGIDLIEGIN